jgi:hypothetical protein
MGYKGIPSPSDIIALTRNKIWATAITAGGITATVLYWISQLPEGQRASILESLKKYFGG